MSNINWDNISVMLTFDGIPSIPCKKITDIIRQLPVKKIGVHQNGNTIFEISTDALTGKTAKIYIFEN